MSRPRVAKALLLLLIASTIGCDQFAKRVATAHLLDAPSQSFIGDTVRLQYAENRGGFLSVGSSLPPVARTALFTVTTGLILASFAFAIFRRRHVGLPSIGLALVVGGGSSNLVDRVNHGAVVDFMNVGIGSLRTGIFNVADVAVMLGIGLLLASVQQWKPRPGGTGPPGAT